MGVAGRAEGGHLVRRIADLVGAAVLLVLSAPALCVGAVIVLFASGRPIFFGHTRIGRNGRMFRCWKLRTMIHGAERRLNEQPGLKRRYVENGFKLPAGEDPRITPAGRWLRRHYIDEIPQLFNVLAGDMSLVGPRPIVADELALYGDAAPELLAQRPGLIGAWTALGRGRPDYPERARLELEYLRTRSLRRDLGILARTVFVVLQGQE